MWFSGWLTGQALLQCCIALQLAELQEGHGWLSCVCCTLAVSRACCLPWLTHSHNLDVFSATQVCCASASDHTHNRMLTGLSACLFLMSCNAVALAAASGRLRDASGVLEGPEGLGRWAGLHGQLVARRNRVVAQLGEAFKVCGGKG